MVSPQIDAGVFAVSTAGLPDRPLCSGLTLAQAIQKLSAAKQPAAPPPPPVIDEAPERGTANAPVPPGLATLDRYVGRYHWDSIAGRTMWNQPAMLELLGRMGVGADLRAELRKYDVSTAIEKRGDVVRDTGCMPHQCSDLHYRLFVDTRTGAAALCLFDGGVRWLRTGGGETVDRTAQGCPDWADPGPDADRADQPAAPVVPRVAAGPLRAFPARFLGRWEDKPGDCRLELDEDDDFFIVEPRGIQYWETLEELDRIVALSPDEVRVNVHGVYGSDSWREVHTIRLLDGGQRITFVGSGKVYVRCAARS